MRVNITAEINEEGDLIIGEYDMSSSASHSFGSDIEINLFIAKDQKKKLMKKISNLFRRVSNDDSLLKWLKKEYDDISALGKIENLLKSKGIDYERTRWP